MKLCPTCGEVYPDQLTVCRAHNTALLDWADGNDTQTSVPTAVDTDGGRLNDTVQITQAGELTQPELQLRSETPPGANVAIDPSLFGDTPKPVRVLGDRYRLGEHIGIGGYGAVFDAFDERLNKRVAVKLLSPAVAQDAEIVHRFKREAIAASRVRHECIVDVTDFDVDPAGTSFIVMEYLDGYDLSDVLHDDGPLAPARALAIAAQCASALSAAHGSGILHRDLKPANIFIVSSPSRPDFVKIIDFGISKITNDDGQYSDVTSASRVVGTPFYMPPEQARGQKLDGRTDVYALGVILFEMLIDERPFIGASALEILTNAMTKPRVAPSSRRPELAAITGLDQLVLRAMSVNRKKRYGSMEEFGNAIVACLARIDPTLVRGLPAMVFDPDDDETDRDLTLVTQGTPTAIDAVKPSTLDSSSGEITAAHRAPAPPSRWWIPASLAVVALAAVAIFWLARGSDDDAAVRHRAPSAETSAEPAPVLVPVFVPDPEVEVEVEPERDAAPTAETIESEPEPEPDPEADPNPEMELESEVAAHADPITSPPPATRRTKKPRARKPPKKKPVKKPKTPTTPGIGIKDW